MSDKTHPPPGYTITNHYTRWWFLDERYESDGIAWRTRDAAIHAAWKHYRATQGAR